MGLRRLVSRIAPRLIAPAGRKSGAEGAIYRGYFDRIEKEGGALAAAGWMLTEGGPYERVTLAVDGKGEYEAEPVERPDVAAALPGVPNALWCGFRAAVPLECPAGRGAAVEARGWLGGETRDSMAAAWFEGMYETIPAPPLELMRRVDEERSPAFYVLKGAQNFAEFRAMIERARPLDSIRRMLDWGCGSGRLISFFAAYSPIPGLFGCDIDPDAIAWAREHIPGCGFQTVPPEPPTDYPDGHFDLITAFSVLTHLSQGTQDRWMGEMRRLLAPGGLLIATLHGETAARTLLNPADYRRFRREGQFDGLRDGRLGDIAPEGYYRASFQTKEYAQSRWEGLFETAEHAEHAASRYHDIALFKKRDS